MHQDADTWGEEVTSSVYATSKAIVIVECPTSRVSVFHHLLKLSTHFQGFFSLGTSRKSAGLAWHDAGHVAEKVPWSPCLCMPAECGQADDKVETELWLVSAIGWPA